MSVDRQNRKEWAREHFRGFENVLLPSFNRDLTALDEDGIRLDVRQSIRHGFFSSLCSLETGLSMEEKKQMLTVACDEAGDKHGIAFSLTEESIEENIQLLEHAEKAGATHALLSYPQSFRPKTQDEVYDFVIQLSKATNLGIYLFVSDKFCFHNLHPSGVPFDAYNKLADEPNIVAMKLGGMDSGMILECLDRFNDRLLVTTVNLGMLPMLHKTHGVQWSGAWTQEALQSPDKPYVVDFFNLIMENCGKIALEIVFIHIMNIISPLHIFLVL